ncbi:hypothetical protein JQ629_21980 [Bradyrhizobium sp. AUGA SZCCT0222]|uniref:hypothetical protein n=1 Tax=Bradyrhizobium sp. AUGA SZCCT0222 TaxID=2807668 RepID=UPI001BA57B1B|nr:hypothetical protein [Bradyrhizobium sp. AUGA SZCCT0222]MBR1270150.1 hypothetical protein [Bradyrhizobium sp. AUGA SZCCT0222]
MVFRDNFVEVQPGFLVDPLLKLRVHFGGTSGLEPDQTLLCIGYDPEIDPNRLLVPPSEEDRRIWLMSPLTAHLVDVPTIFQSRRYEEIQSVSLFWSVDGDRIRYKIENDVASFRLKAKTIENRHLPEVSDNGRDTLFYAITSASRLTALKAYDFRSARFAGVKSAEVWIRSDVLIGFFKLSPAEFRSPEPGWVILSSQEIVR